MIEKTKSNNFIFICSPYRGDIEKNKVVAQNVCRVAVHLGFIPIAPHLFFTQFLRDYVEEERLKGISCGLELIDICSELWIIGNKITEGMQMEISHARRLNIPIKFVPVNLEIAKKEGII